MPKKLSHRLTNHVKFLHKVALVLDGKVLILKRSKSATSRPGKWDLPGGNCEWPAKTTQPSLNPHQPEVAREILEETGFRLPSELFVRENLTYFATFFEPDKELYSINCGWQVNLDQLDINPTKPSQISLSTEHTDFAWIRLEQLANYDFGGKDRDYETAIVRRALS